MIKAFLFDLDGVFYINNTLLKGANETIEWFQKKKIPYRFLTNNTTLSRRNLAIKMNGIGLRIKENEIISANYAGVLLLKKLKFSNCRLILDNKAIEDYKDFNVKENDPEAIVIGDIGNLWNYDLMNNLMKQILNGSKLIALHKGRYYETNLGLTLDSGAFVVGLEHATQTKAIVVGKPESTFFEIATETFECQPEEIGMIGDDLNNDIEGGLKMGYNTFLVKTGKYRENIFKNSLIKPNYCIESIAILPKTLESNHLIE